MEERNYWLGFSSFPGIGPMKFKKLLNSFGSAKDAWDASRFDLEKVIGERLAAKFGDFRHKFSITEYINQLEKKDVSFVILTDSNYPQLLKQIKNPPFVLYGKGNIEILKPASQRGEQVQDDPSTGSGQAIAVVGTRRTTQYGSEVTTILVEELVANGFTIVSGLAIGVDAISHKTAIDNDGKTVAVLGCGVDCCNPAENQSLYNSILKSGNCIVSEFPLGMAPTQWTFPSRNRIIAGLSLGVLVTEGAEDSGSLITADYAKKFGRPVFAVPGPITSSLSKGPYKLIAKGAKLVTSVEDILKEFQISNIKSQIPNKFKNPKFKSVSKEEQKILDLLRNEPLHFDGIVRKTEFKSSKLSSVLSIMEIKGMIKSLDGGMFSIPQMSS